MRVFKKKSRSCKDASIDEHLAVDIPAENDSLSKRLCSPGYLLLHPELIKKAIVYSFIRSALELIWTIAIYGVIGGWLLLEIVSFLYLVSTYGIYH